MRQRLECGETPALAWAEGLKRAREESAQDGAAVSHEGTGGSLTRMPSRLPPNLERHFELVEGSDLGEGSVAVVRRVRDKRDGQIMALKVMEKHPLLIRNMAQQVHREVKLQSAMKHPNILRLFDFLEDDTHIFMLLELAGCGGLLGLMQSQPKGRLCEGLGGWLYGQIVEGVNYLHGQGCVHRDLKPDNILLGDACCPKVCDFGWCADLNDGTGPRRTTCGTLDYMAPEVLLNEGHGLPVDLWSLGILLYEMLAGHTPFVCMSSRSSEEFVANVTKVDYPFPPWFSNEVCHLVHCLLQRQPSHRWTTQQVLGHCWVTRLCDAVNKPGDQGVSAAVAQISPQTANLTQGQQQQSSARPARQQSPLGEGARLGQRRATAVTSPGVWAAALTSGLVASSPSTSHQGLPCSAASTARRPNSPIVCCKAGSHASGTADSIPANVQSQGTTTTPSTATTLHGSSTACWLSTNGIPLALQYGVGSSQGTAPPQGVSVTSSPGSAATTPVTLAAGNSASSAAAGPQPSPQPLPNPPGSPVRTFRHVHGLLPPTVHTAAGSSVSTATTHGSGGASGTSGGNALPGTPLQRASTASWPGCSVSPHRDQAHTAKRSSAEPPPPQMWPAAASTGASGTSAGGCRGHPMQVGGMPMPCGAPSAGTPTTTAAGCSSGSAPGGVMPVLAASGSGTPLPPFPCQASPRAVFGRASAAAALTAAPPPPTSVSTGRCNTWQSCPPSPAFYQVVIDAFAP